MGCVNIVSSLVSVETDDGVEISRGFWVKTREPLCWDAEMSLEGDWDVHHCCFGIAWVSLETQVGIAAVV